MNTDKSFVFNLRLSAFIGGQSFLRILPDDAKLGSFCNSGAPAAWTCALRRDLVLTRAFIRLERICAAGAMAL